MSNKKTHIVLGVILGTLGLTGLGYWYFKGRHSKINDSKNLNELPDSPNDDSNTQSIPNTPISVTHTATSIQSNTFPLKLHSKGDLVKQLQQELIKKFGSTILPKFGADGFFGQELETALISKGFSKTIDSAQFNTILALNKTTNIPSTTPSKDGLSDEVKEDIDISKNLWLYSTTKNLPKLIEQLKRITTISTYRAVNVLFKTIRLHGTRQTIVNGTLNSFSDDTSKQLIRQEFIRIGLKYDGNKWILS